MSLAALVASQALRRGVQGNAVVALQTALREFGYSIGIDGDYGRQTETAVRRFQATHGLREDGIVGPITAAAIDDDAAERPDRSAPPAKVGSAPQISVWPRQADCFSFYGRVGENQTPLLLPFPVKIAWEKSRTIASFPVHEKVHDSALRCFNRIADAYDAAARAELGIDLWGGCLAVRKMRGGAAWSMHAWGIAIDFDPARNQLAWGRDRARLAKPDAETFWRIWEDEGWVSLGRARNYDWMHVQAARL